MKFLLRQRRTEKQISQEALARHLNVSVRTVVRWERGENSPPADKLYDIALVLGCGVMDLIEENEAA